MSVSFTITGNTMFMGKHAENPTSPPPVEGNIYYNTTNSSAFIYIDEEWKELGGGSGSGINEVDGSTVVSVAHPSMDSSLDRISALENIVNSSLSGSKLGVISDITYINKNEIIQPTEILINGVFANIGSSFFYNWDVSGGESVLTENDFLDNDYLAKISGGVIITQTKIVKKGEVYEITINRNDPPSSAYDPVEIITPPDSIEWISNDQYNHPHLISNGNTGRFKILHEANFFIGINTRSHIPQIISISMKKVVFPAINYKTISDEILTNSSPEFLSLNIEDLNPELWLDASNLSGLDFAPQQLDDKSGNDNYITKFGTPLVKELPSGLSVIEFNEDAQKYYFEEIEGIKTIFWVFNMALTAGPGYRFILNDNA